MRRRTEHEQLNQVFMRFLFLTTPKNDIQSKADECDGFTYLNGEKYSCLGKPIMDVPKGKQLTTADITKKQLKETFGFDGYELKSIK